MFDRALILYRRETLGLRDEETTDISGYAKRLLRRLCLTLTLPYEKVGDARREFLFWPLRGTKKGVVQAFFDP